MENSQSVTSTIICCCRGLSEWYRRAASEELLRKFINRFYNVEKGNKIIGGSFVSLKCGQSFLFLTDWPWISNDESVVNNPANQSGVPSKTAAI
jgi:hypothetical protein